MPTRVPPRRLSHQNRTRARGGRSGCNPRRACRRKLRNCIELPACGMKSRVWLGSFSKDPIGLRPDANPYRYVVNRPTTLTDPSGLEPPQLTPEQVDDILSNPTPTIKPNSPYGGINLGGDPRYRPAGSNQKPKYPSLTINFDYGQGLLDPIDPTCNAFGPLWGGYYQTLMNDETFSLNASMTPAQWRYATQILNQSYPSSVGIVQIVGHGSTRSGGPFTSANIQNGPLRDFLDALAAKTPTAVYFRTCYTGSDRKLMQQVANIVNAPVHAGDGLYAIWNWGEWHVVTPEESEAGGGK